jgi:hypothetical protein
VSAGECDRRAHQVLSALAEQPLHGLIVRLAAHDHLPISLLAMSPAKDARGLTGLPQPYGQIRLCRYIAFSLGM